MSGKSGGPPVRPPRPTRTKRMLRKLYKYSKMAARVGLRLAALYIVSQLACFIYENVLKCKEHPVPRYICQVIDKKANIIRCSTVSKEDIERMRKCGSTEDG